MVESIDNELIFGDELDEAFSNNVLLFEDELSFDTLLIIKLCYSTHKISHLIYKILVFI